MANNKLTYIIPAFNADIKTLNRLLHSIYMQSIPVDIIIVSDGDNIDYMETAPKTPEGFTLRQISLKKNEGPGVARQTGINESNTPYVAFSDADDLLASPLIAENAVRVLDLNPVIMVASYVFLQPNDDLTQFIPHENDMIWTFGKYYRREFLNKYKIEFPNTRANEDTCFNKKCVLLADNEREKIVFFKDAAYIWMPNKNSITRINNGQYGNDRCFAGWLEAMQEATKHARKYRPFSGHILQDIATTMIQAYFYHIKCIKEDPIFAPQQWFYIKKYYHETYTELADKISDEALAEIYSILYAQNARNLISIIPPFGIREYFEKLKNDPYNPDEIYTIWQDIRKEKPELLDNNVKCGVMPKNYWLKSVKTTNPKTHKRLDKHSKN